MKKANLCYLIRNRTVLLAKAAAGPCKGLYNGFGGKYNPGESLWNGVLREVKQETGATLDPARTFNRGFVDFYFNDEREPRFRVWMYVSYGWEGEPEAIEKMKDFLWAPIAKLPFSRMSKGDPLWLPPLLAETADQSKTVKGYVRFADSVSTVVNQDLAFS